MKNSPRNGHLLQVKNLVTSFQVGGKAVPVVRGVSFSIRAGEALGVIGESGSGKSVTSLSLMRLIPTPLGQIEAGELWWEGEQELFSLSPTAFRKYRGAQMAMIFQDPMTSLNPVLTIGAQLAETIARQGLMGQEAKRRAVELLTQVGLSDPARRWSAFPHQLSGGMKQRVMIALALAGNPKLLIADEPTTALDVTIQAQILNLLRDLRAQQGMALMMITHDLGVIAQVCERVLVLYGGQIVESAQVEELFAHPQHPYTQGLMRSIQSLTAGRAARLEVIPGTVPALGEFPPGCPFQNRCDRTQEICRQVEPESRFFGETQQAACHFPGAPQ